MAKVKVPRDEVIRSLAELLTQVGETIQWASRQVDPILLPLPGGVTKDESKGILCGGCAVTVIDPRGCPHMVFDAVLTAMGGSPHHP